MVLRRDHRGRSRAERLGRLRHHEGCGRLTTSSDVDLAALGSLSSRLAGVLGTIEDRHWAMATPCADWDFVALVDHVTGGNWFTSQILDGRSAEDAMNNTIELFGDTNATKEQAVSSVSGQLSAFRQAGALERTCHHAAGDLTGRQVLRLRLHDLIVHSWDIDHTLDPPASIPTDLVRWGLDELADNDSLTSKHFDLATVPIPEGADDDEDAEAAYLRCFGR
ncbi:MAG: maleylpyruvate isomerase N-terminal domain-containing protein [Acidimicrobiales bacterium]